MVGPRNLLRLGVRLLILLALLANSIGAPAANATQSLSVLVGPICIWVFEIAEDTEIRTRADMARRVSSAVQVKVEAAEPGGKRNVWTAPDCIRPDQAGFDRQLTLQLSVKRQILKLDGRDWNVVVAGGVSTDGLFQDREVQPVIILKQEQISDDDIVGALVDYVDRTIVARLRR